MGEFLPDKNALDPEAEAELRGQELAGVLAEVLTSRERQVIALRFGLGGGQRLALEAVG